MACPFRVLLLRFPDSDLSPYFEFIWSRPVRKYRPGRGLHRHHIAPRAQFPELEKDPANLITLTVSDHRGAHRLLEPWCPMVSENWIKAASKGGKATVLNCTGLFKPGQQSKNGKVGGKVGGKRTQELHPDLASRMGKSAWNNDREKMLQVASLGGKEGRKESS